MTPRKEKDIQEVRDYYLLKFNDGDTHTYRIGNLTKFLRHLYMDNAELRKLNPKIKSAEKFARVMGNRMFSQLHYAMFKRGEKSAAFYLVAKDCERGNKLYYGGTIERFQMVHFKGFR